VHKVVLLYRYFYGPSHMPLRETALSAKAKEFQSQSCRFFCVPRPAAVDNRCLTLQQGIEKQQQFIAELENYILHAKEPIEHDIKTHEDYKKKVKAEVKKINAVIVELELAENQKPLELSQLKTKYKAYEVRLQQTEDRIIELQQRLNCVTKQIDDYKKSLPEQRVLLNQLQAELNEAILKPVIEPIREAIEHHFMPVPPGA
jgi:chromosome segregation ATPase